MSQSSLDGVQLLGNAVMDGFDSDNETPKASKASLGDCELLSTSTPSTSASTTGYDVFSTSSCSTASTATTALPSPELPGPVANFGVVLDGSIYRCSFPKITNFEHLQTLGLKTVLTLVTTPYPLENQRFISDNGIMHVKLPIPANKNTFDSIPLASMERALSIMTDPRNHPILVHCNKGKHRTGCVVACYRKLNHWPINKVLEEYRQYAGAKARPLDEKYITLFDEQSMKATISSETAAPVGKDDVMSATWKSFPARATTI